MYSAEGKTMSEKKGQKDDGGYWLDDREYIIPDVESRQSVKHEPVVTMEEIEGVVAMGWCAQVNANKVLDPELVFAISVYIEDYLKSKGMEVKDDKNQS